MIDLTVKELDKQLIEQANYNSFGGTRGDGGDHDYHVYANRILSWEISDEKKRKLLDKLYEKWMVMLRHEAQHVSVMVAGPAKYNAKRLDHSDQILKLSSEFCKWFDGIEKQVEQGTKKQEDEAAQLIRMVEFCDSRSELDPTTQLVKLGMVDAAAFVEWYEKLRDKYRWRKNSNIAKLYQMAKDGTLKVAKRETFFEDANFTAYNYGDRAYIKFVMKPARQLIVALKSRGWWWNNHEDAWSTYPDRVDVEWVKSISERYAKYV